MVIHIQSLHFKADEKLQEYVREKVSKLFSVNGKIIRAEVTLSEGNTGVNRCSCEIRLMVPGHDCLASKSADSHKKAVHATVNTLLRRLRDEKKR